MNKLRNRNQVKNKQASTQYTVVIASTPLTVKGKKAEDHYFRPSFIAPFDKMKADGVSVRGFQLAHFTLQCMFDVANKQIFTYKHPIGYNLKRWECIFTTTYYSNSVQGRYQYDKAFDPTGVERTTEDRRNDLRLAINLLLKYNLIKEVCRFSTKERNKKQYIVYSLKETCEKGTCIDYNGEENHQRQNIINAVKTTEEQAKNIGMNSQEYKDHNTGNLNFGLFAESASKRINSLNEDVKILKHNQTQQQQEIVDLKDDIRLLKLQLKKMNSELSSLRLQNDKREQLLNSIGVTVMFDGKD